MYVTEDTTRADPETLRRLYSTAIRAGASRVCIADTVGHATPAGAAAVVRFVAQVVEECGGGVGIDWHGHRDRDLAVDQLARRARGGRDAAARRGASASASASATRRWTCCSSTWCCWATSSATCRRSSSTARPCRRRPACRFRRTIRSSAATRSAPPPACTPRRSSRRSGRTTTALVDAVYSGVPASLVGREQEIEVGPMSGKSNVVFWLEKRGPAGDRRRSSIGSSRRRRRRRPC